jgi:undecaprenyl-diphosphatase
MEWRADPSRYHVPRIGARAGPRDQEGLLTTVLQAIVLGITQGLTEFAPVSSSGHLILMPWLFHWSILNNETLNKTFDVALHAGTFVGAATYFRKEIAKYLAAWVRSIRRRSIETVDERLAWYIIAATIPGGLAGAAFEDVIDRDLGQPWLIAIMLALFGVVLYVVDRRSRQAKTIDDLRFRQAMFIGLVQALALQPGVSRSGVTITAARGLGLTRDAAARFSFLLSLPIIGGAAMFKGVKLLTGSEPFPSGFTGPFVWGMVASAVSGLLVIWALLAYLRRRSFAPFVLYRLAVAVFVLSVIASGLRSATVG